MTCPYCRDVLGGDLVACGCGTAYHPGCWTDVVREHGHCAIYGCPGSSAVVITEEALARRAERPLEPVIPEPARASRADVPATIAALSIGGFVCLAAIAVVPELGLVLLGIAAALGVVLASWVLFLLPALLSQPVRLAFAARDHARDAAARLASRDKRRDHAPG